MHAAFNEQGDWPHCRDGELRMKRYLVERVHNGTITYRIFIDGVDGPVDAIETVLKFYATSGSGRWRATEA